MKRARLGLHTHILPRLAMNAKDNPDQFEAVLEEATSSTIFDCRNLPTHFVLESGSVAKEECEHLGTRLALPFGTCYFEFDDEFSVLATTYQEDDDEGGKFYVEVRGFIGWSVWDDDGSDVDGIDGPCGEVNPHHLIPEYYCKVNCRTGVDEFLVDHSAEALFGVISLLSEKLLASELVPDPEPRLTKARAKRGAHPLTADSHVLTVNVGAVRRAARALSAGSHESPCLHWRRGHARVIHRGSEFESRTWVKKCLVGDPARGFSEKSYRLMRNMPMLAAAE